MEKRLKVVFHYSNCNIIAPRQGDFINEIGLMRAFSHFADVYYSNCKYDYSQEVIGYADSSKSLIVDLKTDYDIYYIRANPRIVKRLPKDKFIIAAPTPFNKDIYARANMISVPSQYWKDALLTGKGFKGLHPDGYVCNKVENFGQVFHSEFKPLREHPITKKIRRNAGDPKLLIGFFGRLKPWNMPSVLLDSLPYIQKHAGKTVFMVGATNKQIINHNQVINQIFQHKDMPYVYSACDFVIESYRTDGMDFPGSIKVIESAACGTPIIMAKTVSQQERLGKDYPLFVSQDSLRENDGVIRDLILNYVNDKNKWLSLSEYLTEIIQRYSEISKAEQYKQILAKYGF